MANLFSGVVERVFGERIEALARERVNLAVRALDDSHDRLWGAGDRFPRERRRFNREEILKDALDAWRDNPLARRVVALTTQYVVGGGISIESDDAAAHEFLNAWWNHRLNRMLIRCYEWCDELTRTGEIFPTLATDVSGMSYVRAIPASLIAEIECAGNDLEQEIKFMEFSSHATASVGGEARSWAGYREQGDAPDEEGKFETVMLHYAINRPIGALRGESDLAPILRWLTRYAAWLEDRVRLNRFRQSFLYVVYGKFKDAAQRLARQAELNANPPNPGSILVADDGQERWDVMSPKLDSFEANTDGLAVKKMVAVGAGAPLHFLAEPESATRTTAESSDEPTFRHYEQRQIYFRWILGDVARIVLRRRAAVDKRINPNAKIVVKTPDIYARDNGGLATAAKSIIEGFLQLRERNLIDDAELLRLAYRFAGEVVDVEEVLKGGEGSRWQIADSK